MGGEAEVAVRQVVQDVVNQSSEIISVYQVGYDNDRIPKER